MLCLAPVSLLLNLRGGILERLLVCLILNNLRRESQGAGQQNRLTPADLIPNNFASMQLTMIPGQDVQEITDTIDNDSRRGASNQRHDRFKLSSSASVHAQMKIIYF